LPFSASALEPASRVAGWKQPSASAAAIGARALGLGGPLLGALEVHSFSSGAVGMGSPVKMSPPGSVFWTKRAFFAFAGGDDPSVLGVCTGSGVPADDFPSAAGFSDFCVMVVTCLAY
jgi:hypothetical protein